MEYYVILHLLIYKVKATIPIVNIVLYKSILDHCYGLLLTLFNLITYIINIYQYV